MTEPSPPPPATPAPRRLRARRRALFVGVLALAPLVLLEAAARVAYQPASVYVPADGGLEFRFAPRASLRDGAVVLNDRGFWDVDRAIEKPAGVTRLIALGDSFTFGYTALPDTIPGRLERELAARRPDLRVEVHNLGQLAYGTDQQVVMLEREGLPRRPDVALVFFYVGNDVRDNGREDERRVVAGKLVSSRKATLGLRLLRSSALFRFFDDGAFRGKVLGEPQRTLLERARRRRAAAQALVAEVAACADVRAAAPLVERATALAREAVVDRELLEHVPPADWLARERQVVAAAEREAAAALAPARWEAASVAASLERVLGELERRADAERALMDYGLDWITTHARFVPVYRPGHEDEDDVKGWERTEALLLRARDLCAAAGVELRVVVLPSEVQVCARALRELLQVTGLRAEDLELEAPQRRVLAICQQLGVPALDVLSLLRETDARERVFYMANTHMNEVGNRVVAERVAEWLAPALRPPAER